MNDDDRISYSPAEAAAAVGVGRTTIYELISSGQLRSCNLGRRRLISRSALLELIDNLEGGDGT
jgi:excisionase family DNA binding protein